MRQLLVCLAGLAFTPSNLDPSVLLFANGSPVLIVNSVSILLNELPDVTSISNCIRDLAIRAINLNWT